MAEYLDKAQINTAITDNTKLDLGCQHITTQDFMQLNVAYMKEMVPGEKLNVNMETFARLNPLPVPTFGRASMRHRAFFVPFRTIFRGFNDFITDSAHITSDYNFITNNHPVLIDNKVPTVSNIALANAFLTHANDYGVDNLDVMCFPVSSSDPSAWDFVYNGNAFKFSTTGRQAIKMLEQLGYKVNWNIKDFEDVEFSAMPLLALARIFCDWYFPSQYRQTVAYDTLQAIINQDVVNGSISLQANEVWAILTTVAFVYYDSDYFTSAWDRPNEPVSGNYSDFKIVNIDTVREVIGDTAAYTPSESAYVSNNSGSGTVNDRIGRANAPFISPYITASSGDQDNYAIGAPISEYLLHSLHALTDYMKRHQMAGARAFDRYLARFGKALSAEKLNRSMYLGSHMQDIQIGDVMATADTISGDESVTGAQLGAYAGKGLSYGQGSFDMDTDEYGYFIILTSLVPNTGYYQGIDRQVMRISKLQFYTPEFDALGVQPITTAELYINTAEPDSMDGDPYEHIFGFTPRYADYKVSHDRLTGNFRLPSINGGTEESAATTNTSGSWHLMRVFRGVLDYSHDYENFVHSLRFMQGAVDKGQYKRIFYNNGTLAPDNFTIINNFDVTSYSPMKSLYDTYEFEDKGKKVTLETNGVKLN